MLHIIQQVDEYIRQCGGSHTQWYAGIASRPRDRLFVDHGVREKDDAWIFRDCASDAAARQVEDHFLTRGCQGGPGGGDYSTKYFYAYKIRPHTLES